MRVRKQLEERIEIECPEVSHEEIRKSIMDNPFNLGFFCGELTEDDWDVCLAAAARCGFALQDVPECIQKAHPEICEAAIRQSGHVGLGEDERGFPSDMVIAHVINPSPELLRLAVAMNGMALEYVPREDQAEDICMEAVRGNPFAVRFVRIDGEACERVAMAAVEADPTALEFVPHQTHRLCMAAIEADGMCLRFVREPTDEMRFAAVRQCGMALEYVRGQTEELCMEAVRQNPFAIIHADIEDDDAYGRICLAAVESDPAVIEFVSPNASRACLAAVRADGMLLRRMRNPTHEICLAAVRNNGQALRFVEDQTASICLAALLQDPSAIECVDDCVRADAMRGCGRETAARGHLRFRESDAPHLLPLLWKCAETREEDFAMDVLKDIVAQDPHFLRHVENQTKEICMMAVQSDGMALEHVKPECLPPDDYAAVCMEAVRSGCGAFRHVATRSNDANPSYDDICREAVRRNGALIEFVDADIARNYFELALESVRQDGANLKHVSLYHCKDYGRVCLAAVANDGMALKYAKDQTPRICLAALRQNMNAYGYVSERLWKSLEKHDPMASAISEMLKQGRLGGYCERIAAKMMEFLERITGSAISKSQ